MAIFTTKDTKVLVQGITGRDGAFHSKGMIEYGTNLVAGVTPGKGGQEVEGVPVFDTVAQAVEKTGADTSVIFVPAAFCMDAMMESCNAGIKLIVCISEGVPANDMLRVISYIKRDEVRVIGPNCPGMISTPGVKLGILPGNIVKPGKVGVISRSGTLTYEVVDALSRADMGQSSCIGIGGDTFIGTNFIDCLQAFEADPETDSVVLIGEIGGSDEEMAAEFVKHEMKKPVVGFISGRTAPKGVRMGHAGAIISGASGTAESKIEALEAVGIPVAESPSQIPGMLQEKLK
jgi:succinyl-CoA synthetase alpha subunit